MKRETVPNEIIGALSRALSSTQTKANIHTLCMRAGLAPIDVPSKVSSANVANKYVATINANTAPWAVANALTTLILDDESSSRGGEEAKKSLRQALAKFGRACIGGRLVENEADPTVESLDDRLRTDGMKTVREELGRAMENVDADPAASLTAASSLLEALFKTIIDEQRLRMPNDKSISSLWGTVQKNLNLSADGIQDDGLKQMLGGLTSIVRGVGTIRTHAGSAHGRSDSDGKPEGRHARLAIGSATALALFVIEHYAERKKSMSDIDDFDEGF